MYLCNNITFAHFLNYKIYDMGYILWIIIWYISLWYIQVYLNLWMTNETLNKHIFPSGMGAQSHEAVALGPGKSSSDNCPQLIHTCILCQEEQEVTATSRAMVLAAFVQKWAAHIE